MHTVNGWNPEATSKLSLSAAEPLIRCMALSTAGNQYNDAINAMMLGLLQKTIKRRAASLQHRLPAEGTASTRRMHCTGGGHSTTFDRCIDMLISGVLMCLWSGHRATA